MDDRERFREMCTYLILATDMSKHMVLFKELQAWMAECAAALQGPRIFGDNPLRRGRH